MKRKFSLMFVLICSVAISLGSIKTSANEDMVEWKMIEGFEEDQIISSSNVSPFTNIGSQVSTVYPMKSKAGMTASGIPLLYLGMQGETSVLVAINLNTGQVYDERVLEGAKGVWSIEVAADQTVWVGTTPNESLYSYDPNVRTLTNHGKMTDRRNTTIWDLDIDDSTGYIYGGTSYGGSVFRFHPIYGVEVLGSPFNGKDSVRSVAIDPMSQTLFAGVGSRASLIAWDIHTDSKIDILPDEYKTESFVYDLDVEGGYVFAKLQSSKKILIFDAVSYQFLGEMPALSRGVSAVSPDGTSVYYTSGNSIYRFDLATRESHQIISNIRSRSAVSLDFVQLNKAGFPGYTLVGTLGNDGLYFEYNLETGKQTLGTLNLPAQPIAIHNIIEGLNGGLISSGFISGNIGIYNPSLNTTKMYTQQGQMEGAAELNGKLYMGMYPKANFFVLDQAAQNSNSTSLNVKEIKALELGSYRQERPVAMVGVDQVNKLFIGSYPSAGERSGAFAIYDPTTEEVIVRKPFITNQSVIALAYNEQDEYLYGGTTIHRPGFTEPPSKMEASFFRIPANNPNAAPEEIPLPLDNVRMITALTVSEDGRVWGMADGTLFVYDGDTFELVPVVSHTPGYFKNATLRVGKDGHIYGTVNKIFFRVKSNDFSFDLLRNNQDADRLATDQDGNFYFVSDTTMWKADFEKLKNYSVVEQDFDLTIPNVELPTDHNNPIARLFVTTNVDLLKEVNGRFIPVKRLEPNHFYRTYGAKGNYYDVGGNHYVYNSPGKIKIFIGRTEIYSETPLYAENGAIHRMLQPGESIRVYSYDLDKFDVGGGFYVLNDDKVEYFVGYATIKEETEIVDPNGQSLGVARVGDRYHVYEISNGMFRIGNREYIKDQKEFVDYAKN